ncbi:GNAT family N-acetyltransferase [Thalassotalea agarivorans]|uniref:Acetyltransferase (GNAT) family protein n=1 Tax=Thalassotalea agarivorans TaxID=349064 RepID=A0A1I0E7N3_THASX|nr:GNAT family N-acetyltransferase [Thalassotalea agarivorans]SET41084.1 Acetyltransferase (GNAT) family protein [Thalassotalea agarivorans]
MLIRPATPDDIKQAIPLMYSSGPEAFNYVFSVTHESQSIEFLSYAYKKGDGEFGYQDHFVAEINGEVVGLVGYRPAQDNLRYTLSAIKRIFVYYGLLSGLKVIKRGLAFEKIVPPPPKNTACLHNFGVSNSVRGQGIGARMMTMVAEKAKQQGYSAVVLDVAETNPKAKALYLRQGYQVIDAKTGRLQNRFGRGVSHELMQLKL